MNSQEIWHVEVQNRVYEASYEEVIEWIKEGAVTPEDKVRRGNLRWLNAGRVPAFHRYFFENRAPENLLTASLVSTTESNEFSPQQPSGAAENPSEKTKTAELSKINVSYAPDGQNIHTTASASADAGSAVCSVHADRERYYICQICKIIFCKDCPHSFGSSVKICLDCGGLCITYAEFEKLRDKTIGAINRPYARIETKSKTGETEVNQRKLSKGDFLQALLYPAKFPAAFLAGAVLLTIFTAGKMILAIGGLNLFFAALGVSTLSVMLVFSVLMKTVENHMQSKTTTGFMPRLDKYTIWEDFIHPIVLGAGACLMTFGLFLALTIGAGVYAWTQFSDDLEATENQMRSSISRVNATIEQLADDKTPPNSSALSASEHRLRQNLQKQADAVFGSNYLGDTTQLERLVKSMLRLSVYFQMPICFAFIFGCLVLPAVCSVAALTRSFGKTVNPLEWLKMINKLGFDYVLILMMSLAFVAVFSSVAAGSFYLFSSFDQSFAGVLGAIAAGCFSLFYFWLVLSQIIVLADSRKNLPEAI